MRKKNFKYPKLLHLYWDGSPLSFLHYLTILSFNKYHKGWKIIVYMPQQRTRTLSWTTFEQKQPYTGACYFDKLYDITNVTIQEVCLDELGFYSEASEVIKSDYLRYYILQKYGGVWSDFDILYTSSIEEAINCNEDAVLFKGLCYESPKNPKYEERHIYWSVGFFVAKPNNKFFKFILDCCREYYNPNEYQCIGSTMFEKLFPCDVEPVWNLDGSINRRRLHTKLKDFEEYKKITEKPILDVHDSVAIIYHNNLLELYSDSGKIPKGSPSCLPWSWNEIDEFLEKKENTLPSGTFGLHWFNGADKSREYTNNLDKRLNHFKIECYLDNYVKEYLK